MLIRTTYHTIFDMKGDPNVGKLDKFMAKLSSSVSIKDIQSLVAMMSDGKWMIANNGSVEREATPEESATFGALKYNISMLDISIAIESGLDADFIKTLVEHDKINMKDEAGNTPLFYVAERPGSNALRDIRALVEAGALLNQKNSAGNSPIHAAALNGQVDNLALLATLGADMEAKNHLGQDYLSFIRNEHIKRRVETNLNGVYAAISNRKNQDLLTSGNRKAGSL